MIIDLPYRPMGHQVGYFNLNTRFTVGCIGRQYGKSTLAMLRMAKKAIEYKGEVWWVSPIVAQARSQYKRFLKYFEAMIGRVNKSFMEAELVNGSIISFKGSDNYEALRGATLTHATLDECATMHISVWPEIIRPMLTVKNGTCDFTGTPKGKNWFHNLYHAKGDDWSSFHGRSVDSPFFSQDEWDKIKLQTTERIFRQEYEAEFLDSDSEVFRGISDCLKGSLEEPNSGAKYVMGVDLAKTYDWTVLTVWDLERRHMVAFERFNQIDWPFQEKRIISLAKKYNNARVVIDATGVGDPVYVALNRSGLYIEPVKFTNIMKQHLIENLSIMIEKRDLTFPHIPEIVGELQTYEFEMTSNNNIRYNAPQGYHDDIVISMALAANKLSEKTVKIGKLSWA